MFLDEALAEVQPQEDEIHVVVLGVVSSVGKKVVVGTADPTSPTWPGGQVHCSAVPCTRATYCQGVHPPQPT